MSGVTGHEKFLTLIQKFLDGQTLADTFCTDFTKLWVQYRDAEYAVLSAKKATWSQPYDELLIAAFQRGEMSGADFRKEHARLCGYEEDEDFLSMINQTHSACSVYNPSPHLEGEIDEEQFRREVKTFLADYERMNKPASQAASVS